jgi:hypothetical protein
MSIELAIIPLWADCYWKAINIQSKLEKAANLKMNITIDTNYNSPLTYRINKWIKLKYNIVTVKGIDDFDEQFLLKVLFSEKDSNQIVMEEDELQSMEVDEFIDLVASFEHDDASEDDDDDDDETNTETEKNIDNSDKQDDNQEGGCVIM